MGSMMDTKVEYLDPNYRSTEEIERNVEEIRIPTSFGFISGKWWGRKDVQPILGLHGWQDNAGTFDRLIPLLPKDTSFLCIDLPGHGLSSKYQDGISYHMIDYLSIIEIVRKEYRWDKVAIMGHSLGSILGFMYAAIYPEHCSMVIGIDALRPGLVDEAHMTELLVNRIKMTMIADERNQRKSEPPSYTYVDLLERVEQGTNGSVTKEVAPFLLRRNIRPSEKHLGKYYFTRDSRLKTGFKIEEPHRVSMELARKINIPYLAIKAGKHIYYGPRESYEEIVEVMQGNPNFYHFVIEAKHHLHLTDPETIAPLITDFIYKYCNKSKL